MLTNRRRQRKQQKTFFVYFFAIVLYDDNVKLPETSCKRSMEEMLHVVLFTFFSLPLFFNLVAASISHFLTAAKKFHVILQTKLVSFCWPFYRTLGSQ